MDRQDVLSKSATDGFTLPKAAVEDALSPDIVDDIVAAKDYVKANIPKGDAPLRLDRVTREELGKHQSIVEDIDYHNSLIEDVSTQLTDVERSLNVQLKRIDEQLPDIGTQHLADDVPFSPLLPGTPREPEVFSGGKVSGVVGDLYHGTRVQDLQLRGVNPLEGAARSEYGTGIWLTTKESIATSAAGRRAPNNHIPNVNRTYSEDSFIHTVQGDSLSGLRIVNSNAPVTGDVAEDIITQLTMNRRVLSDHVGYGDELLDDIVNLLDDSRAKGVNYGDLFGNVDDLTHKASIRATGSRADEFELTYVQRVMTDMLESSGVDGITNGVNTALYNTRNLTSRVHDVTDIVGDSSDEVALALHNVNLLQASSDAAPSSMLLKVQLEEAKAVAASRVRDQLSDELDNLNAYKSKAMSDLLDQDDVVREIGRQQQNEALIAATIRNDDTHAKFSKELNKDFTGPCL
jgi:hypothetical protein